MADPIKKITIDELVMRVKLYDPKADIGLIDRAYDYAMQVHKEQKRASDEPYIYHPLEVSNILAKLEQDTPTIVAALLHDAIEDAEVSKEEISALFGPTVAELVDGVTKLGRLTFDSKEEQQAENFRKMFLAMGQDIRVIIIKLADRLHNMQTLRFLPPTKIKEIATETRDIFAPLAHRLGIWDLKWELEDLSFRYLEPEKFNEMKNQVSVRREERERYIKSFIEVIKETLAKVNIKPQIKGRPKHFYSIYQKLVKQNLEFDDLYDLLAIRIIVEEVKDCYATLGVIHAGWKPIPGRFRDYVAMPKSNGYQSLHTTVIGPEGRPVEIQIRTVKMHRIAEHGIAAHWRYKEGGAKKDLDDKLSWLRQMLDIQNELEDAKDFMDSLKIDLFTDLVFVFTPKGQVHELPMDSSPIDFAYHIHTEVGHRCVGAKVNGKIVPLDYYLQNGDIVEILTSKTDNPSLDWLKFAKTAGAKTKIKQWFKKQKREENVERGRKQLVEEIKKLLLSPDEVLRHDVINSILPEINLNDEQDMYAEIGHGEISPYSVAKKIRAKVEKEKNLPSLEELSGKPYYVSGKLSEQPKKQPVSVLGVDNIAVRFSRCCRPLPGDEILGFVTTGRGLAIHRKDCPNMKRLSSHKERIVNVEWEADMEVNYPIEIEVEVFDRVGVLKDILAQIAEIQVNVSGINVHTRSGSSIFLKVLVDVKNTTQLQEVFKAIRCVSDVYDAYRAKM